MRIAFASQTVRGHEMNAFGRRVSDLAIRVACIAGLMLALAPALASDGAATGVGSQFELVFWQSVSTSEDERQLNAYLERYPAGTFANLARAKLAALPRREPEVVAANPAGPAAVVAARLPLPAAEPMQPQPLPKPMPAEPVAPVQLAPVKPAQVVAESVGERTPLASAVAPAAPATTATVPPALQPRAELTLAEQLRALGMSQGRREPVASATTMPPHPALAPIPELVLPPGFCSAEERNGFHDNSYRPAVEAASTNNRTAIGHMETLRGLYDQALGRGDHHIANAVAEESRVYAGKAKTAYETRAAFDALFKNLMSVPILDCGVRK